MRLKFLDKWLSTYYANLLAMIKVENGRCIILSKNDVKQNDISKDTHKEYIKKIDFIGNNILTIGKVKKILYAFSRKNNIDFFKIHTEKEYIRDAIAKYIKLKLKQMQK